jgi:hypothetical protein
VSAIFAVEDFIEFTKLVTVAVTGCGLAVNICVCRAARDSIPGLRATLIGTASLKSRETMGLFRNLLTATARTVAELVINIILERIVAILDVFVHIRS